MPICRYNLGSMAAVRHMRRRYMRPVDVHLEFEG